MAGGLPRTAHGITSHDTFRSVLAVLDPARFLEAFGRWTEGVLERLRASGLGWKIEGVVAIDGKARGALDAGEQPRVIVGAWAARLGLCLGKVKVNEKSNEPERSGDGRPAHSEYAVKSRRCRNCSTSSRWRDAS